MDDIVTKTPKRPGLDYLHGEAAPGHGEMMEITPQIQWIRLRLPFALEFINVWLVDDGDGWTIIDTGMPLDETRQAWRDVLGPRVTADKPLKRVIITHLHPDHVGTAGWLCRKYQAELCMSRLEYTTCRMLIADTGREAPEAGTEFYRRAGWGQAALDDYRERFGGFGRAITRMPDSFLRLSDGDTFEMGGETWEVVIGSGHSPEHACLYCPAQNILISGDQLLPRISSNVSVHPTEPAANPLLDWMSSCEKLLAHVPEDVLVLPAHNEPFRGAHKRLRHLIDGHEVAMTRLKQRLADGPMTVLDTFGAVFGRKIKDDEVGMATGEAIAHLNCLIYRGEVTSAPGPDGVTLYRLAV